MKKIFYLLILLIPSGLAAQKNIILQQATASKKKPSWLLTGNSGTNPAVNFLGTTDAQPLVFRVNNQTSGFIDLDSSRATTAFGYRALQLNTGIFNTAHGYRALSFNTNGEYNTANGSFTLYANTSGLGNTANGAFVLYSNTTGSFNTATGQQAMLANTTGYNNTANGVQALVRNTDGHDNTATGSLALFNNTGTDNTANGSNALFSNTTGSSNVANGEFALYINTTGVNNTATGGGALFYNSTGNNNVADGLASLFQNTTGNNNTALGFNANVTSGNLTNATVIGHTALVDSSNKVRLGNDLVNSIGGQVSWTNFAPDDLKNNIKENVPGLAFIKALRPVTYNLSIGDQTLSLNKNNEGNEKGKRFLKTGNEMNAVRSNKIEQIKFTGLIAKEVDSAAKKVNYNFSGVDKNGTTWGLRYAEFVVPLIKSVQELSKRNDADNNQIDSLEQSNKTLNDKLDLLTARLDQMQAAMSQCCSSVSSLTQSPVTNQSAGNAVSRPRLEQNTPNPFKNNTVIKYFIPSATTNARIIISDASGTLLKTIILNNKGIGQAIIPTGTFPSGSYFYNLLIDGKTIDTKKMLIIK